MDQISMISLAATGLLAMELSHLKGYDMRDKIEREKTKRPSQQANIRFFLDNKPREVYEPRNLGLKVVFYNPSLVNQI